MPLQIFLTLPIGAWLYSSYFLTIEFDCWNLVGSLIQSFLIKSFRTSIVNEPTKLDSRTAYDLYYGFSGLFQAFSQKKKKSESSSTFLVGGFFFV